MSFAEFRDFSFCYGGGTAALQQINLTIGSGLTLLVGGNGSGKTTLLRQLLPALRPHGSRQGELQLWGKTELTPREAAEHIGYLGQDPQAQLLTDRVWRELALTAENLGWPQSKIAAAIDETAAMLGIGEWLERDTAALSAGQRQLVALAAALVTRPRLLLLDEPCSHLDAEARELLLAALRQVLRQRQIAVVVAEQDFAPWLELAQQVCYLEQGRLRFCLPPTAAVERLQATPLRDALPLALRVSAAQLQEKMPDPPPQPGAEVLLSAHDLSYTYGDAPLLQNIEMELQKGSISVLLGRNGCGKTTLLELLQGVRELQNGQVSGRAALLPARAHYLLLGETVGEALCRHADEAAARAALRRLQAEHLWQKHPADLSGGQKQRAALALLLLAAPQVLLLDEPEAGLDAAARRSLAVLLRGLRDDGLALLVVTHDADFAAAIADRGLLLEQGRLAADLPYAEFVARYESWQPQAWQLCAGCLSAEHLLPPPAATTAEAAEMAPALPSAAAPAPQARRASVAELLLWLLLPLTLALGWQGFTARRFMLLSLLLLTEAALPLLLRFERKGYTPRQLAFLAAFCALAVAGRLAFFILPQVKPLLALCMLGALFLGAESGLWLGATSIFLSNFFFTQGPWTPWQMLAAGLSAALFGVAAQRLGRRGKALLAGVLTLLIYGPIANLGSLLIYQPQPTLAAYGLVMLAGLPFDITHAVVTAVFIWYLLPPLQRRISWLRQKYGV